MNEASRFQSRKFLLALLTLIAGTALVLADRLTDSWVDLALFINVTYGTANLIGHKMPQLVSKPADDQ